MGEAKRPYGKTILRKGENGMEIVPYPKPPPIRKPSPLNRNQNY
jgi:hypothetical protein